MPITTVPITIDGRTYTVGTAVGSFLAILVDPEASVPWRKTYRRRAGPEDDASFQARVQADVTRLKAGAGPAHEPALSPPTPQTGETPVESAGSLAQTPARSQRNTSASRPAAQMPDKDPFTTPSASPASTRPKREVATKGKATPDSAAAMAPPPPRKRTKQPACEASAQSKPMAQVRQVARRQYEAAQATVRAWGPLPRGQSTTALPGYPELPAPTRQPRGLDDAAEASSGHRSVQYAESIFVFGRARLSAHRARRDASCASAASIPSEFFSTAIGGAHARDGRT